VECWILPGSFNTYLSTDLLCSWQPDWQLVIIGPVAKSAQAVLQGHENIHYLGGKYYKELPAYLTGWDLAMLPFVRNESTRFIMARSGGCLPEADFLGSHLGRHESADRVYD
jgi:hypothetical protein